MAVSASSEKIFETHSDALLLPFFEGQKLSEDAKKLDAHLNGAISSLFSSKEFSGKENQLSLIRPAGSLKTKKILLVGLGKEEKADSETFRSSIGKALLSIRNGTKTVSVALPASKKLKPEQLASSASDAFLLSTYSFLKYKSKDNENNGEDEKKLQNLTIICEKSALSSVSKAVSVSGILCNASNFAREIANEPGNVASPSFLAETAKKLAKDNNLKCKIIEKEEMQKLGMNSFISVSKGSVQPPKLIILEHNSEKKTGTIEIVGKGVTFDSGGISLKPGKDMDKMRFDKSGGCAVLGIMKAVSELNLPIHVVGIIPATENMPSGSASKPGDIVKSMSGKTIEILNTDAEGRLILADALSYAQKNFKPTAIIDMATLTGACVVALGDVAAGVMGNDEKLIQKIRRSSEETGEKTWELPLWREYSEKIKGDVADIKNIGPAGGDAGAITAAAFLLEFIEKTPWAHIDIAGTAYDTTTRTYLGKGSTGFGVRLVANALMNWK